MMTIEYPSSRANVTNCKVCMGNGIMQDDGYVTMQTEDGRSHRLLKRTCYYCGYTVFLDKETARKAEYKGGHTEIFSE